MPFVIRHDGTHGTYFAGITVARLRHERIWWDAKKWAKKFKTAGAARRGATMADIKVADSREDADEKGLRHWVEPLNPRKPRPA